MAVVAVEAADVHQAADTSKASTPIQADQSEQRRLCRRNQRVARTV
jgi:hypothetical protein